MKNVLIRAVLVLLIILVLIGIGFAAYGIYKKETTEIKNPIATMEVEGFGTVKIELYPNEAPNTVTNFIRLANRGFYNGLIFHRTIPGFMIQGGDKTGKGNGTPKLSDIMDNVTEDKEYNIPGEFIINKFTKNNIKHEKGVISMARADYTSTEIPEIIKKGYDSAGSQFFIMTDDNNRLDEYYAAFGKVIDGMDVIEKISNVEVYYRSSELKDDEKVPTDENGIEIESDRPKKAPVIKSISVETYGVDYGIPETVDSFDYYTWLNQQYKMLLQ